jgi:hypothetical protein
VAHKNKTMFHHQSWFHLCVSCQHSYQTYRAAAMQFVRAPSFGQHWGGWVFIRRNIASKCLPVCIWKLMTN